MAEIKNCPVCGELQLRQVPLKIDPFAICSNCLTTVIKQDQIQEMRRQFFQTTRVKWLEFLKEKSREISAPETFKCVYDQSLLEEGLVPEYNEKCYLNKNLEILYILPQDMIKLLEVAAIGQVYHKGSSYSAKVAKSPFSFITKFFLKRVEKEGNDPIDDALEEIQYGAKLEAILTGKVNENS